MAHAVLDAHRHARPMALLTPLDGGVQRLLDARGLELLELTEPAIAEAARAALATDRVQLISDAHREIMVTPHNPPLRLVIVGAVHISETLCAMAQAAGYAVTLVDPRSAFLRPERFPGAALFDEWPQQVIAKLKPDSRTAVVFLTHDPKIDDPGLIETLNGNSFYVGALGSTRTQANRIARLRDAGVSDASLARIHGPAGLDIGARTPAEIAISVLAEITATLRGTGKKNPATPVRMQPETVSSRF